MTAAVLTLAHHQPQSSAREGGLAEIDAAYALFAKDPAYMPRIEQQELSHLVARALLQNRPFISEAPTGSGKTIGYSVGALAACRKLGLPLVISTATVSLQRQVIDSDMKRIEATGLVSKGNYKLVRGRGRFFCPYGAESVAGKADDGFQKALFDDVAEQSVEAQFDAERLAPKLLDAFADGWEGTIDEFPAGLERPAARVWAKLSSNSETCLKQKCPKYSECPFFKERAAWSEAPVLVANHNIVLLDLLSAAEGRDPVFPFGEYVLVLDEAHHLPERALSAGKLTFRPGTLLEVLSALDKVVADLYKPSAILRQVQDRVGAPRDDIRALRLALEGVLGLVSAGGFTREAFEASDFYTPNPEFLATLLPPLACIRDTLDALLEKLREALSILSKALTGDETKGRAQLQLMYSALGTLAYRVREQHQAVDGFEHQQVKWLSAMPCAKLDEGWEPTLNGSPLEGRQLLERILWEQGRARVVMVSATLKGTNGFDHFVHEVGLTGRPFLTKTLPARFKYQEAELVRVSMGAVPGEPGFVAELISKLPEVITPGEGAGQDMGTLVLFTNRATMKAARTKLLQVYGDMVIAQDFDGSAASIRSVHCERIDAGRPTILLGLKSLAEGFDLPGRYCTHVVVTQIPFDSPADPLQQAREQYYGAAYFSRHILPKVARELNQIVGRLLRRESDWGRISVMDERLYTRRYGAVLLNSLPPFTRVPYRARRPGAHLRDVSLGVVT